MLEISKVTPYLAKPMSELARMMFSCLVKAGDLENQALLLARSIRQFGGKYAASPIALFSPDNDASLSRSAQSAFNKLGVAVHQFRVPAAALGFPFADKVIASSVAERNALDSASILVWMDTDSLVLKEPFLLDLAPDKALGYRPVDHTLIGSRYNEAIDPFWQQIYLQCSVPTQQIFPMSTSVDQVTIRPYINAGMLVVRPERGLLAKWSDTFSRLFKLPTFTVFYEESHLYKIFIHQAILAGTILASLQQQELLELHHFINYPLHMHADYPKDLRPASLNEITSCRYDPGFSNQELRKMIAIHEPLKSWLDQQITPRKERTTDA